MAKIFTSNLGGAYAHGGGQVAKFIVRNAGGVHTHLWARPGISYSNVSSFDIIFSPAELISAAYSDVSGFDIVFALEELASASYSDVSGFDIIFAPYGLTTQTFLRLYLEGYPVDKLFAGKPLDKLLEGYPVMPKFGGKPTS